MTYVDHGWRHKPKSKGGTDPIPLGGIQFDTYPQVGGYLYVETDDAAASPNGYAIDFADMTVDAGIRLYSDGGAIDLEATQVAVNGYAGGQSYVFQSGTTMRLGAGGTTSQTIIWHNGGLASGTTLLIKDSSNNPLFRIDADGTLHMRTGASLVADL